MAYSTTTPPRLQTQSGLYTENSGASTEAVGGRIWIYRSADAKATVAGSGYFTNATDLGLLVNDIMYVVDTATPKISIHRVTAVGTSTLSTGTDIS